MELSSIVQLIGIVGAIVGVGVKLERRLLKIEVKLDRCPHVKNEAPLVARAADF